MGQSTISIHLDDSFYGVPNAKILKESIEQMEKHPERNVVKTLEELEELADGRGVNVYQCKGHYDDK